MSIFDLLNVGGRERDDRFVAAAKNAPKGMGVEHLLPGALVTMSASKATGDRSYCHDIYEVVAVNAGTALFKPTGLCEKPWTDKLAVIQIYEREFYTAETYGAGHSSETAPPRSPPRPAPRLASAMEHQRCTPPPPNTTPTSASAPNCSTASEPISIRC